MVANAGSVHDADAVALYDLRTGKYLVAHDHAACIHVARIHVARIYAARIYVRAT
jgi:hypothetical protein